MIQIDYIGRDRNYEFLTLQHLCFECSVCSLHCVVQHLKVYDSSRTFFYELLRSDEPQAQLSLWCCSACHKCSESCPQDVDLARVVASFQERSLAEGYAPSFVYKLVEIVISTGMSFPVTQKTIKEREDLGLLAIKFEAVEHIQRIAKSTGLLEKLKNLRSSSTVIRSL
jgi:heterodisulfide reductase subunit C